MSGRDVVKSTKIVLFLILYFFKISKISLFVLIQNIITSQISKILFVSVNSYDELISKFC